jgi:TfoX/Sxy family transcriptional regulator of competence genes
MAYDKYLAERVERALERLNTKFEPKHMFGGVCYMVDDKMCVGVVKNELMARLDPDATPEALMQQGCRLMDFTGKSMKGFVFVTPEGTDREESLENWLRMALEFNPKAKISKKR